MQACLGYMLLRTVVYKGVHEIALLLERCGAKIDALTAAGLGCVGHRKS